MDLSSHRGSSTAVALGRWAAFVGLATITAGLLTLAGCAQPASTSEAKRNAGKFHAGPSKEQDVREQDPRKLLERMAQKYSEAASYADSGEFHILTEEHGRERQSPAIPYSVTFVRPNKLRLQVLAAVVIADGEHFWAAIQDEDYAGQVLMLPSPATLTLPQIFADPKLAVAAHGAFNLPIPTLELLLAEKPLAEDLRPESQLELLEDKALPGGGPLCRRVRVTRADGTKVYWIDPESLILRRCDFPTKRIQEQVDPEHALERLDAWADFTGAQFQPKLSEQTFKFEAPANSKFFKRFPGAGPQPPRALSPLLGTPAAGFAFVDLDGQQVSPEKLRGKVVVLDMWATWCGWCFRGFPNLEKVYQRFKDNDKVVILAVSNDEPSVSDAQVKQSFERQDLHIPIARDPQDFSHSLFHVEGLPTTIVLGPDGSVQDFEAGYRPDLAEVLPGKIERLLAGGDLVADQMKEYRERQEQYERAKQQYDKEVADALVGGTQEIEIPQTQVTPRSEPATFKLTQLWSTTEAKSPGNVLVAQREPDAAQIYVIDGSRSVAEFDPAGKLVANHPLGIPETAGVSFLRTGVDGHGQRSFAAFASPEQQLYVYDVNWQQVTAYPEGKHPGLADVRLADLSGDGQLRLQVAYWGSVGVQTASLAGKRLAANRALENVAHLTVVGPDGAGKSRLLASNGNGALVWLDENLEIQGEISIPNRALLATAVASREGRVEQICAISSVEVGAATVVGISPEGQELWSYDLPPGVHQRPLEMLLRLDTDELGGSRWLVAAADGSLHFLNAGGKLVDTFACGEALTGLAATRFGDRPGLLIATASGLTAWRCDPQ